MTTVTFYPQTEITGEDISKTAKRELYKETGAVDLELKPVCFYGVTNDEQMLSVVRTSSPGIVRIQEFVCFMRAVYTRIK